MSARPSSNSLDGTNSLNLGAWRRTPTLSFTSVLSGRPASQLRRQATWHLCPTSRAVRRKLASALEELARQGSSFHVLHLCCCSSRPKGSLASVTSSAASRRGLLIAGPFLTYSSTKGCQVLPLIGESSGARAPSPHAVGGLFSPSQIVSSDLCFCLLTCNHPRSFGGPRCSPLPGPLFEGAPRQVPTSFSHTL